MARKRGFDVRGNRASLLLPEAVVGLVGVGQALVRLVAVAGGAAGLVEPSGVVAEAGSEEPPVGLLDVDVDALEDVIDEQTDEDRPSGQLPGSRNYLEDEIVRVLADGNQALLGV